MRPERGFTITELMVAMAVSLLVSLAGWSFYRSNLQSLSTQSAELEAAESVRSALAFMTHEIRLAGLDPMQTAFPTAGSRGISIAETARISVQFDRNSVNGIEPNLTDPNAESVTYVYDSANGKIDRTVNGVTSTLVRKVPAGGFQFEYLDENGNTMPMSGGVLSANRDNVRFVRMTLTVQGGRGGSTQTLRLTTRATLRNRILGRL